MKKLDAAVPIRTAPAGLILMQAVVAVAKVAKRKSPR